MIPILRNIGDEPNMRLHRVLRKFLVAIGAFIALSGTILWYLYLGPSPIRTFNSDSGAVYNITFSPDGKLLASRNFDGRINIWDIHSGHMINSLPESLKPDWFQIEPRQSKDGSIKVEFPDFGKTAHSRTISVIDTNMNSELIRFCAHPDQVNAIAISPDNRFLVTGGGFGDHPWPINSAGDVRIWELKTGRLINRLTRHWDAISSVTISHDRHMLATSSLDGVVMLWNLDEVMSSTME